MKINNGQLGTKLKSLEMRTELSIRYLKVVADFDVNCDCIELIFDETQRRSKNDGFYMIEF